MARGPRRTGPRVIEPVKPPHRRTEPAGFDPGEHTVAAVEAYVAEHPDEADSVLAAERAGKNRVSLVGDDTREGDE